MKIKEALRTFQQFTIILLLAFAPGLAQTENPVAAAPAFQGIYTGTLGDQRIVLEIGAAGPNRDQEQRAEYIEKLPIEGRYFYRRHGVGILLEGQRLSDGRVWLKEYRQRKVSGAEWKISFSPGGASGFFCKCDASQSTGSGELKIALTRVSRAFDPALVWPDSLEAQPDQAYYDLLLDFPVKSGPAVRVNDQIEYVVRSDPRFDVKVPRLTRFPDGAAMEKINQLLDSHFLYYRLRCALGAQGEDFGGGDTSGGESVELLSRDFLSLLSVISSYSAGALHPNGEVDARVYNMRTGERFDFEKFFLPPEEIEAPEEKDPDPPSTSDRLQRALGGLYLKFNKQEPDACDENLMRSNPAIDVYFTRTGMALLSGNVRECGGAVIVPYSAILPLVRKDSPFRAVVERMGASKGI
jgi:hypothetical protein